MGGSSSTPSARTQACAVLSARLASSQPLRLASTHQGIVCSLNCEYVEFRDATPWR